ncbi:hypothetical protein ACFV7Q_32685 [Streptomyces sp. NPDC059851]|uniref:hypothetical protein n=1 Tax=Streptomyces sp. NPDC059851 TaxID=3346971 RepID=UPI00364E83C1
MSGASCPQCGTIDLVRSVRAVYEEQTGTYAGVSTGYSSGTGFAPGVGPVAVFGRSTVHTSGVSSTLLAQQLAPPPQPILERQRGGCALAVLCAVPVVVALMTLPLLASGKPGAGHNAMIFWGVLGLPALAGAVATLFHRALARRSARKRFQAQTAAFPALFAVWEAAFTCGRCHLAYLPAGPFAPAGPRSVPVPGFQQLVWTVAQQTAGPATRF